MFGLHGLVGHVVLSWSLVSWYERPCMCVCTSGAKKKKNVETRVWHCASQATLEWISFSFSLSLARRWFLLPIVQVQGRKQAFKHLHPAFLGPGWVVAAQPINPSPTFYLSYHLSHLSIRFRVCLVRCLIFVPKFYFFKSND